MPQPFLNKSKPVVVMYRQKFDIMFNSTLTVNDSIEGRNALQMFQTKMPFLKFQKL